MYLSRIAWGLGAVSWFFLLQSAKAQVKGPSTATTPYILPIAPGVKTTSILTTGERGATGTQQFANTPDGIGLLDNGNGTFTAFVNHEFIAGAGLITKWVIEKSTLKVLSGAPFNPNDTSIFLWNNTTGAFNPGGTTNYILLCSADLPAPSAFSFGALGTSERIFMSGEETTSGRQFGHVVTGPSAGNSYELASLGRFRHENSLANPFPQLNTVVGMTNDTTSSGYVYFYVGEKKASGLDVEKAGLVGGNMFVVSVAGISEESQMTALPAGQRFTLPNLGNATGLDQFALATLAFHNSASGFRGAEDSMWDPLDPSKYYFATTDRYDQVKDGVGTQVGRSRLWLLDFDDITNPAAGGTISMLLDGSEMGPGGIPGPNMLDNMTTVVGADGHTRLMLQEDTGLNPHNAKIWLYDTVDDSLTLIAGHDRARFGDIGLQGPLSTDEESSGIVDASAILGPGWFLLDVQPHVLSGSDPGGQLLAMYVPQAVPEPGCILAAVLGMFSLGGRGWSPQFNSPRSRTKAHE